MDERHPIWLRAQHDLIVRSEDGSEDVLVWEHATRVARSAVAIARLIGLETGEANQECLVSAALYQDRCWILQHEDGTLSVSEMLSKPLSVVQMELAATRARQSLADCMPSKKLESVCRVICEAGERRTTNIGAQILADATNLDQIGPLALFHQIRRQAVGYRTVAALLKTWDRQREYNFWPARVKEGFRFEPVRRIAEQRLLAMEVLMDTLRNHANAEDLAGAISDARSSSIPTP